MNGLIAFVTPALAPFSGAAIGRVIANLLVAASDSERSRMAVIYLGDDLLEDRFNAVYPGVRFIAASVKHHRLQDEDGCLYPPVAAYLHTPLHARSVLAMQVLKAFESENGPLDYVEFIDQGGTAFAATQEKYAGRAFQTTVLAVRLYGPLSMFAEPGVPGNEVAAVYDLERKALSDCDVIVAESNGVARAIHEFLDFDAAEWRTRLKIHSAASNTRIVAPSKGGRGGLVTFRCAIRTLDVAEMFIRACCGVLRQHPDFRGNIHLDVSVFDTEQHSAVRGMIPRPLASHFYFIESGNVETDPSGISICVFPSSFDIFFLDAYEASHAGAWCVINRANPACDIDSPWRDPDNCSTFDGSVSDLAGVLSELLTTSPIGMPVHTPSGESPWWQALPLDLPRVERTPLVTVVIPHYNLGAYLDQTLASIRASDYPNVEIVVVDDASTDPASIEIINRLSSSKDPRLTVVSLSQNQGLAASRNAGVLAARGDFVLPLDADDLVSPRFISMAVGILVRHDAIDFVVPQAAYFDDGENPLAEFNAKDCLVFVGEARALGFRENRFSTATMVARKEALQTLRYREHLRAFEDWDLYQRAVGQRRRFIVTNTIQFYYRRRIGSMIHSAATSGKLIDRHRELLRSKFITFEQISVPLYVLFAGGKNPFSGAVTEIESVRARLHALEHSKVVGIALMLARAVKRLIDPFHRKS
jgi:glycosyltransferase involved in cell wall biosynthesis